MFPREVLKHLSTYTTGDDPHGQMDQSVIDRCAILAYKEDLNANDIKQLLDDCVYGGLCSNFIILVLDLVWKSLQNKI